MNAEIFPQKYRGFCSGITIAAAYSICFVCVKLYPWMTVYLGTVNVCIFYGTCSLLSILYVLFIVPETKGKTLAEIENMFKSHYAGNIQQVGSLAWAWRTCITYPNQSVPYNFLLIKFFFPFWDIIILKLCFWRIYACVCAM